MHTPTPMHVYVCEHTHSPVLASIRSCVCLLKVDTLGVVFPGACPALHLRQPVLLAKASYSGAGSAVHLVQGIFSLHFSPPF